MNMPMMTYESVIIEFWVVLM